MPDGTGALLTTSYVRIEASFSARDSRPLPARRPLGRDHPRRLRNVLESRVPVAYTRPDSVATISFRRWSADSPTSITVFQPPGCVRIVGNSLYAALRLGETSRADTHPQPCLGPRAWHTYGGRTGTDFARSGRLPSPNCHSKRGSPALLRPGPDAGL